MTAERAESDERREIKENLPAWLPSLSRTLALNSEQPPTVCSGRLFSTLWGQKGCTVSVEGEKAYL